MMSRELPICLSRSDGARWQGVCSSYNDNIFNEMFLGDNAARRKGVSYNSPLTPSMKRAREWNRRGNVKVEAP